MRTWQLCFWARIGRIFSTTHQLQCAPDAVNINVLELHFCFAWIALKPLTETQTLRCQDFARYRQPQVTDEDSCVRFVIGFRSLLFAVMTALLQEVKVPSKRHRVGSVMNDSRRVQVGRLFAGRFTKSRTINSLFLPRLLGSKIV